MTLRGSVDTQSGGMSPQTDPIRRPEPLLSELEATLDAMRARADRRRSWPTAESPGNHSSKVIYRSKRCWHTKRNCQIFEAVDFLAATVEHIPLKNQQAVHYYGHYSNKSL